MTAITQHPSVRNYIGIDPGDKWVGVASMTVVGNTSGYYYMNMGVLNRANHFDMSFVVDSIVPQRSSHHIVVCESFQQRPVGYNRFGRGDTLRLMGALQYLSLKRGHEWNEIPPGDPNEVYRLYVGKFLDAWLPKCPKPEAAQWKHAWSAWRVMARWLMMRESKDLTRMRPKELPPMGCFYVEAQSSSARLTAPRLEWNFGQ